MNNRQIAHFITSRLEPGKRIDISALEIRLMDYNPLMSEGWTRIECIMEAIVGSAYEYRYYENYGSDTVTFERLLFPLPYFQRTYLAPDRREGWKLLSNGIWEREERTAEAA